MGKFCFLKHSENILVNNDTLMIGLPKQIAFNNEDGISGMLEYIEPLCYKDPAYRKNNKSDIYSLGVLYWEISSGQVPFSDIEPISRAVQIGNGKRETPIKNTPL